MVREIEGAVTEPMNGMTYMDHAASSPPYEEVIDVVTDVMRRYYGNPSSLHGAGAAAEKLVKQAASVIAERMGASPDEIVFTSGGTESNNLAILGAARRFANRGNHVITTRIEHASVYECFRQLEREGYEVTYLDADHTGAIRVQEVAEALRDDTILVSVMAVNNETGRVQPIEEIGKLLAERPRTLFHVDGVQAAGKMPLNLQPAHIDLLSLSAHKFRGPKGVGILYRRQGLQLEPVLYGGGQQGGLRSGTENVPLIVGAAKAFRIANERMEPDTRKLTMLREQLIRRLSVDSDIIPTGTNDQTGMIPHIVHFRLPGLRSEVVLHTLEQGGFYVSSQSACSSGEEKPSRVLLAMGLDEQEAKSGLRISLCAEHTQEDIDRLADVLLRASHELRQWMG